MLQLKWKSKTTSSQVELQQSLHLAQLRNKKFEVWILLCNEFYKLNEVTQLKRAK